MRSPVLAQLVELCALSSPPDPALVFINRDRAMYHEETDTPALARTSNLNEELGMVNTILSDKTGTLTRNVMEFFKCSIAGVSYGTGVTEIERAAARRNGAAMPVAGDAAAAQQWRAPSFNFYDKRLLGGAWRNEARPDIIREFFRVLAVCHTVIPDGPDDPDSIKYQAESPDEAALVAAGKAFGFFFHRRNHTSVLVCEPDGDGTVEVEYEILNILEFDSTRKRMSVICRTPSGNIMLYCKGADTVIYERLDPNNKLNSALKQMTREHMEMYGEAGLRTLCLSCVELDPDAYNAWQEKYYAAKTALHGRDEKLAAVAEEVEKKLQLLGCTAIEDKLQEGVPECIERLAAAGIRIWVLTGDKQETAINIGFACSLLRTEMVQYIVTASTKEVDALEDEGRYKEAEALAAATVREQLSDALRHMARDSSEGGNALIIDGKALVHALADDCRSALLAVGQACAAVVCCRVSPKQKAQVTALVKSTGDTTLGIGDGANDVGMIQEAHIGVGISGQEGMQAVMSSDFAIAQFRFLEPLLLVHGRWSYLRITRMVSYFFYKNILFGLTIFFYNALCFFSGQIIYNDFYMSLYNVIFTVLPPLIIGMFDQDVDRDMSRLYPGLYQAGPKNLYFRPWALAGWVVNAIFQAAVMFVMVMFATQSIYADRSSGTTFTHWEVGSILFTVVVVTVHLEIASILDHWTPLHHLSIWFSVCVWILYLLLYGVFPLSLSQAVYHLFVEVLAPAPVFWLIVLLIPFACVLPGFLFRQVYRRLFPDDRSIIMEIQELVKAGKIQRIKSTAVLKSSKPSLTPGLQRSRTVSVNCGYVPADKPGSLGYYTPQHAQDGAGEGSGRHPVIAALDQALTRDPQRHRTSSLTSSAGSGSIRTSFARRTSFVPSASPIGSPAKVLEETEETSELQEHPSSSMSGGAAPAQSPELPGPSAWRPEVSSSPSAAPPKAHAHEAASPSPSGENPRVGGRYDSARPWQQPPHGHAAPQDLQASTPLLPGMPLSKNLEKGRHATTGAEQETRNKH
ncbi:Phospholipid-transporting ATPase 3 [Coccomyxa sp. Obi]|nr:Phospholipid-transporting ATPase 3 [Coccomyxa sp. Obi]